MNIAKTTIRRELLAQRRALGTDEWRQKSDRAALNLMGVDAIRNAASVHCYVSMEQDRETGTMEVLEHLQGEGKAVFMPYIEKGRMRVASYLPGQRFLLRKSGPPVPDPLFFQDVTDFDAVIVPLVGTDLFGRRIGYGKGWYDRFFADLEDSGVSPVRIGFCFDFQVLAEIPADPWDQYLDLVVTENGIRNCSIGRI